MKFHETALFKNFVQAYYELTILQPECRDEHYEDAKGALDEFIDAAYTNGSFRHQSDGGDWIDRELCLKIISEELDKSQEEAEEF